MARRRTRRDIVTRTRPLIEIQVSEAITAAFESITLLEGLVITARRRLLTAGVLRVCTTAVA